MLTLEQQAEVERLIPQAKEIARSFGRDDQFESEAMLALCEAVSRQIPYPLIHVRLSVQAFIKREWRRREVTGWSR